MSIDSVPLDDAFSTPLFFVDPPAVYRRLRTESPVFRSARLDAWLVSRYDDCLAVLKDPARFSNHGRLAAWLSLLSPESRPEIAEITAYYERGVVMTDPPDHARMRAALNRAFTPHVIEQLRGRIQSFVDDRIDTCADRGRLDLVGDLAYPLPVTIICELVGVPVKDEPRYLAWTHQVFDAIGTGRPQLGSIRAAQAGMLEMEGYFRALFEERRREPREDLMSALLSVPDDERGMSDDDLRANFGTFISAGHESTTSLIVNGLVELVSHPEQVAAIAGDPGLAKPAVEEMLRWVTPFQRDMRLVTKDVELRGVNLRTGDLVWCLLAAANRDPEQFDDPERFDIRRTDNRHLAFAMGPHFCLGAPLARLEASIVVRTVCRRLSGLRLADEPIVRPSDYRIRTPQAAWVEFDAVGPRSAISES